MSSASAIHPQALRLRLNWQVTPVRLALILTALAVGVRTIGLGVRPLWLDEAYSAWFSARGWHYLWTAVPTYEPHPPFYYSLLKAWRSVFGGQAVALRALSVLFGALAVPLVVAAVAEVERQDPSGRAVLRSGIAAFLVGFAPMLVLLGQEARPYPLMIFAYAAATLGLLRLLREFGENGPGGGASWLLLAAGTELALWAHGLGVLYAVCLAAALMPAWLGRPLTGARIRRGIATAAAVAALYLPCLLMIASRAGDWGTGWLRWDSAMPLQLLGLYGVPAEALTVGSAVAALALLLLIKRALDHSRSQSGWTAERALLVLWWGPPLLAVLVSVLAIPIFLPRTLAPTLVPAYIAIAGALSRSASARERLALAAALVLTLIVTAVQVALRPPAEPWNEVSAYLHRHVRPGDRIWVYPNDSALPLDAAGETLALRGIPGDYPATSFTGPIRAGSPAVVSLTGEQARAIAADSSLRPAPTVWLVTRQSGLFDPDDDLPKALATVREAGARQQWGYIAVQPFFAR